MSDTPPARQCTMPTCEDEAIDPTEAGGLCPAHTPGVEAAGHSSENDSTQPEEDTQSEEKELAQCANKERGADDGLDDGAGYLDIFRRAQELGGREDWEFVTEDELQTALAEAGFEQLLQTGALARTTEDWQRADLADAEDEHDWRWFYTPAGLDPRPKQFRTFHQCLMAEAPECYEPYYFRVEKAGKAPATEYGSWKKEVNRLSFEEAIAHMEDGGNVGIAGKPDDPLVNFDIDDGEATEPEDFVETLRAKSRSRGESWHGWGFNPEGDIPNLPTDELGEIRTDWQYVVAPGSFVASASEEIPDDADDPGFYTVEHETSVPTVTYDDLPQAFRDWEANRDDELPPEDSEAGDDLVNNSSDSDDTTETRSEVFDVTAKMVASGEGGDTDTSNRWTALFHGSDTSANMSVSGEGRLQCWRHNVAHGGLQALATLSDKSPSGDRACRQIGTGHKHSNAGGCKYKNDWRLVWWAWEYGKNAGYIPESDPIPFTALLNLAVRDNIVSRDDLVERESESGGNYVGFPDAEAYNAALDHVQDTYDRDPGRERATPGSNGADTSPVSALPLAKLDALDAGEMERYARKRGLEWPSTEEARARLKNSLLNAIRAGQTTVIDAPTSMGKSFTAATIPWLNYADHTGETPVVHLHPTRDARDEAASATQDDGGTYARLLGRSEACFVAAGDHDPAPDGEDDPDQIVTIDGVAASHWLEIMCEGRGLSFSVAHAYLREHNDQELEHLPCCSENTDCPAVAQWKGVPYDDDGNVNHDIIHATHNFAHVPSLRRGTNIIMDERPDFAVGLTQDRVRRAVTAFLNEVGCEIRDFEHLLTVARDGLSYNEHAAPIADRWQSIRDAVNEMPDRDWFIEADGAHVLAPALTRALLNAEERANGRLIGKTRYEPPRFDVDGEGDGGAPAANWITVVLDEDNNLQTVRDVPSFGAARSVVGLDAHPAQPVWAVNTHPDIDVQQLLDTEERRLWRYFERGLEVVQVGDATRPLASGEYFNQQAVETLASHLRERYGEDFSTAITSHAVEADLAETLEEVGVSDPETMHYGEEKSRNDFDGEEVGFLEGCIDPGDDYVLNLLAELDLEAEPEMTQTDDGEQKRAHGRGFVGEDGQTAQEILASVREEHVAQAAGRYARNPEDPDDRATVYVHTDAMPSGFADVKVSGVEWVTSSAQQDIIETLQEVGQATAQELADEAGVTREHARETVQRLAEEDAVRVREHAGDHGAHLYRIIVEGESVSTGFVDIADATTNADVWDSCTCQLEITPPTTATRLTQSAMLAASNSETIEPETGQSQLDQIHSD